MSPRILMIDSDTSGVRIRAFVLESSGYAVTTTTDPDQAKALLADAPDAIVCSVQVKSDGKPLVELLRQLAPKTPVVAMVDTPYGHVPEEFADRFILKLDGPKALLGALAEVLPSHHHRHTEFQGEHIVFVDKDRRYLDVTEKAAGLVGYTPQELVGKRIEDVSVQDSHEVRQQFSQYLVNGEQSGVYVLRHRDGHPVLVRYRSLILPDGCMAAEWEPLNQAPQRATTGT